MRALIMLCATLVAALLVAVQGGTELGESTGTTQNIVVVEEKSAFHWLGIAAVIILSFLFFFLIFIPALVTSIIRCRCNHSPCSVYSIEKPKGEGRYGRVLLTKEMARFGAPQNRAGPSLKIDGLLIILTILSGRVLECFTATIGTRKELFEVDLNMRIGGQLIVKLPNASDIEIEFEKTWKTGYCEADQQLRTSCNGTCSGMLFTFSVTNTTSLGDVGSPALYDCDTREAKIGPKLVYKIEEGAKVRKKRARANTCATGDCNGRVINAGDRTCTDMNCPGPCKHTQWSTNVWCYQAPHERKMVLETFKRINTEVLKLNTRLGDAEVKAVINEGRLNVTQFRLDLVEKLVNSEIKDLQVGVFRNHYLSILAEQREVRNTIKKLYEDQVRSCGLMTPEFLVRIHPGLFTDTVIAQAYLNIGQFECLYDPRRTRVSVQFSTPKILGKELYSVLETLPHRIKESETTCSVGVMSLTAIRLKDGLRQPWGSEEILARTVGEAQSTTLVSSGSSKEIDGKWRKLLDNEIFVHPEMTGTTFDSTNCPRFQIFWANEFALVISLMTNVVVSGKDHGKGVTMIQYTKDQILFQIGLETFKTPTINSNVSITLTLYSKDTWDAFTVNAGRVIDKTVLKLDRSSLSEKLLAFENHTAKEVSRKVEEYKKVTAEAQESLMKIQTDIESEQNRTWARSNMAMAMGTGAVGTSSASGCCFCIVCLFVVFKVVKKLMSERYGSSYTHNYAVPSFSIVRNVPDMMWIFTDKIIETRSVLANVVIFISWKFLPNLRILMVLRIIPVGACVPRRNDEIEGPGGIEMSEASRNPELDDAGMFGSTRGPDSVRKFGKPGKNKVAPMSPEGKSWGCTTYEFKNEEFVLEALNPDPRTSYEHSEVEGKNQSQRVKISDGDLMIRNGNVWAIYNSEGPYMMGGFTWHADGNIITNGLEDLTEFEFEDRLMSGSSP